MKILVLNVGSSSQKCRLYEMGDSLPDQPQAPLWEANADWSEHQGETHCKITTSTGQSLEEKLPTTSRQDVLAHLLKTLWSGKTQVIAQASEIDIVGHRVVHGGQEYRESTKITPAVKDAIKRLSLIDPLHNPLNLEDIEAIEQILPRVPQVAVFDTAFHSQLPMEAVVYPGPYEWFEQGIRRYGFHGISHQYCAQRAAQLLERDLASLRLVTCHIGNGCSLAAIQDGHSIDTTMGFTPLEGLMMGSRSGSVDPGILIYLMRQKGYSADQLDTMLNKESGLKGVSGVSGDMRAIHEAIGQGNERAKLAFAIYVHRLRSFIGSMIAVLGGLDALVFAGGVGENDAEMRADVCAAFAFLGLHLDPQKNAQSPSDQDIAAAESAVRVLIVSTQEDWSIAKECWRIARA
ncbi:MAG: acetate kinase [Chloroflexi bacterium]|nr:MAG: acetate kinase [Chloroflexota bacterium]TMD80342.1 MAG: acetate kinase [Chloroflexota bacterium]